MAELAGRLLAKKKKKTRVKSNVLIQCQASGLRSSPQTFISPPRAIKGGIRGPKETKSWWIELISPPMMDGPAHRGLENRSIVHLSLRLPCPSMICTPLVKATSGQKTSLLLLLLLLLALRLTPPNPQTLPPQEFPAFLTPPPPRALTHAARCTKKAKPWHGSRRNNLPSLSGPFYPQLVA